MILVLAWADARRLTLERRLAAALAPLRHEHSPARAATPLLSLEGLLAPVLRDGVRALERWGASTIEIENRLRRAGRGGTAEQFRASQVVAGAVGLAGGLSASVVLGATRGSSPIALLILTLACCVAGVLARDHSLTRAAGQREARLLAELPAVAEMLALSVSAGEGALGALDRVSRTADGALADEIRQVLGRTRAGMPLSESIRLLGDSTEVAALRRFADAVATSVERGTPLADVLRAQADDVRSAGRTALMEEGGRREILMMIPVIFLILPVTVLFAAFPGIVALNLDF